MQNDGASRLGHHPSLILSFATHKRYNLSQRVLA